MKKETIVQFVCFQTSINLDAFISAWEQYNNSLGKGIEVKLQQQDGLKTKFKYVSRHTVLKDDFHFVFVKGRKPEHFNDCNVRVVQAGGYAPIQIQFSGDAKNTTTKILAFLSMDETDIEPYKALAYQYLNIYQAYYESCSYSYILEFYVNNKDLPELLNQLKTDTPPAEIGVYKECSIVGVHA